MKKQIVFKDSSDEIVQIVRGDGLDEWLERAKVSESWNDELTYEFEDYDDRDEVEDAEILH